MRGGYRNGAGRRGWHRKTGDMRQIDVRRLVREKWLYEGASFCWGWKNADTGDIRASIWMKVIDGCLECSYTLNGQHDVKDRAPLITTECNYGGKRYWFACPCCGGRCAVLYLGKRAACRKCHKLAYPSQCENAGNRALRRAQTIRQRLGVSANMLEFFPVKPKGMHWRTFQRLKARHDTFTDISLAAWERMIERFGMI